MKFSAMMHFWSHHAGFGNNNSLSASTYPIILVSYQQSPAVFHSNAATGIGLQTTFYHLRITPLESRWRTWQLLFLVYWTISQLFRHLSVISSNYPFRYWHWNENWKNIQQMLKLSAVIHCWRSMCRAKFFLLGHRPILWIQSLASISKNYQFQHCYWNKNESMRFSTMMRCWSHQT